MRIIKVILISLFALLAVAAGAAIARFAPPTARLVLRVACPTVFIEKRTIGYAEEKIRHLGLLPVDPASVVNITVTENEMIATVLGMVRHRAVYHPGEGCVLQD
jgi:hypothetical protein